MSMKWPERTIKEPDRELPKPTPDQLMSASEIFHDNSALRSSNTQLYSWIAHVNSAPDIRGVISRAFTHFPGCPVTPLPRNFAPSPRSFEEILENRRSARDFNGEPMSLETLSKLLYFGDGISTWWNTPDGLDWPLRTAPSGGGLFPIETYCMVLNVEGLAPGLYFYHHLKHNLECVVEKDLTGALSEAIPGQAESVRSASVCVILSAVMQRIKFKYGERAYRFLMLEAGHIAQNLLLTAEAEGVGGVAVGGYLDDTMNALLRLDGVEEAVVYLALFGYKQKLPEVTTSR